MPRSEHRAFVGLGANLGDAPATLRRAFEAIAALPGTRLLACSSLWRSAPVGVDDAQDDYCNAVAEIATALEPEALLADLHAIEARFGRTRARRNAARTLDLDLLIFDDLVRTAPELVLPHPRMHERAFVLEPLLEIAPEAIIPGRGRARDERAATAGQRLTRIASSQAR